MLSKDTPLLSYDQNRYHRYAASALSRGINYTNKQICYHTASTIGGGILWPREDTTSLERRISCFKKLKLALAEKMIAVTFDARTLCQTDVKGRANWCRKQFKEGTIGRRWAMVPRYVYLDEPGTCVKVFVFGLQSDALLFKLTWA
jgi:hypothetical protein